jgi:cell filamentation protein
MGESSDRYLYPGTDVLRNIPGIRDSEQLTAFEALNTGARIYELQLKPLPGRFNTAHLNALHKHIFQDVYPWAGQFRTTILAREHYARGPVTYFTPPHLLKGEAQRIFRELHRANLLRGLSRREFAGGAAQLLVELNNLHPYREGNGRTQRAFIEVLARQAGHPLYFDVTSKERMAQASIRGAAGDCSVMIRLFEEITDPDRIAPLRRAIEFLDQNRFRWNDVYLATTTPGQEYTGKLVGRDRDAFMMRTNSAEVIIGRQVDISTEIRGGEHFSFKAQAASAPEVADTSRANVIRDAIAYMRRSKTAIAGMPITERPAPPNG